MMFFFGSWVFFFSVFIRCLFVLVLFDMGNIFIFFGLIFFVFIEDLNCFLFELLYFFLFVY